MKSVHVQYFHSLHEVAVDDEGLEEGGGGGGGGEGEGERDLSLGKLRHLKQNIATHEPHRMEGGSYIQGQHQLF